MKNVFPADKVAAGMAFGKQDVEGVPGPFWMADVECVSPNGDRWTDQWHNSVQNTGKIDLMNRYFGATGGAYNTWYIGLHNNTNVNFVTASAQNYTASEVSGFLANGTNTNSSSVRYSISMASNIGTQSSTWTASFGFWTNATQTVGGLAVLNSGGLLTGTAGTNAVLYSMGNFAAGSRQVQQNDTLNVTLTLSMQ